MNLFNSVILLFVVHPFDVGDALLIPTTTTGSGAAEYCVVEELSLVVTFSSHVFCLRLGTRSAPLILLTHPILFCMHFIADAVLLAVYVVYFGGLLNWYAITNG